MRLLDAQKYLKITLIGIIVAIVLLVFYALFLNEASRAHITRLEEEQYTVLNAARADFHNIRMTLDDLNLTVNTVWSVDMKAQQEGVITELSAAVGQYVRAGDRIAKLTNSGLRAQLASAEASIEEARASLENYEQDAARYTRLMQRQATSVQKYESALAKRDAASAQLKNRIAQRDLILSELAKLEIFASQDAEIINVYHKAGDYVRAGEAICMLADLGELRAYCVVEHDALEHFLKHGQNFTLEIPPYRLTHRTYPVSPSADYSMDIGNNKFSVTVENVVPDISANASQHEFFLRIQNPNYLLEPTYYNDAKFISATEARILSVPLAAVNRLSDGTQYVYGVDADSCLTFRPVRTGVTDGNYVEIIAGLSQGDVVIVDTPIGYKAGTKVRYAGE